MPPPAAGASGEPLDLAGFTLIVDDTVSPDGSTAMEQVGGGGPQTLWGYQLARAGSARVGLAAGVGRDLPASVVDWLRGALGCDTSGLLTDPDLPTPRAWQVMEHDGRRTQVWRSPECDALYRQLRPKLEELPERFRARALGYHVGIHAEHPPMGLLRGLRAAARAAAADGCDRDGSCGGSDGSGNGGGGRGFLSIETYTACDAPLVPGREAELRALLAAVDVFSPNEAEARSMLRGPGSGSGSGSSGGASTSASAGGADEDADAEALALVEELIALGAATVLLRRGADGVLAAHGPSGDAVYVPAVPGTRVRDVVGCGNACCGAFLAAYRAGGGCANLAAAAAWGCAAGSVMAEHVGVPRVPIASLFEDAQARQAAVLKLARPARLGQRQRGAATAAVVTSAAMGWGRLGRRPGGGRAVANAHRACSAAAVLQRRPLLF